MGEDSLEVADNEVGAEPLDFRQCVGTRICQPSCKALRHRPKHHGADITRRFNHLTPEPGAVSDL